MFSLTSCLTAAATQQLSFAIVIVDYSSVYENSISIHIIRCMSHCKRIRLIGLEIVRIILRSILSMDNANASTNGFYVATGAASSHCKYDLSYSPLNSNELLFVWFRKCIVIFE